jgi:ATP-binding cassette subfamily B protein
VLQRYLHAAGDKARRRGAIGLLVWSLRETGGRLATAWAFGLIFQGGLLLLPWCLGRAIDDGISARDQSALLAWAGAVLAVSVLLTAGELGMRWYGALGADRTANRVVARLTAAVVRLDRTTVGRYGHGDLVLRGTRDTEALFTWLRGTPSLFSGLFGFAGAIVAVALLDDSLAVVGLATLPLLIAVNLWYPPRFERASALVSDAHARRADAAEDLLTASTAVRGLGGESVLVRRHHQHSDAVTAQTLRLARVAASWSSNAPFVPALAGAIGLLTGGLAVLDGRITVGTLVTFTTWMALLSLQVITLTERFSIVGLAYTAAGRIAEVLGAVPLVREREVTVALPATGDLTATGLRAEPPGRPPLTLPDLCVRPGEFVALTGVVGSGKTTLLRLLARLEDPSEGTVSLGGVPLTDAAFAELRQRITIVGQRPSLVSGTIAENLRLGHAVRSDGPGSGAAAGVLPGGDDELRAACRVACIDEQIIAMPDGYATRVGERGSTLSGGQVQRLALARALLRRASVLLLDDVTSGVDAATENAILDRLRDWAPGTTIIAATSRPEVVRRADRVIHLGDPPPADLAAPADPASPGADIVSVGGNRG